MNRQELFSKIDKSKIINKATDSIEVQRLKYELQFFDNNTSLYTTIEKLFNEQFVGTTNKPNSYLLYLVGLTNKAPDLYKPLNFRQDYYPVRISDPDIDTDFEDNVPVQNYAISKYGKERVAKIGTFNSWKAKGAIQNASKYHDFKMKEVRDGVSIELSVPETAIKLASFVKFGTNDSFEEAVSSQEMNEAIKKYPKIIEILNDANKLFGVKSNAGKHAAAIIISDEPILDYIPIHFTKETDSDHVEYVTQFDMKDVEALGFIKNDFLCVKTIKVFHFAYNMIKANKGHAPQIRYINPLDPQTAPKIIQTICGCGITSGVFQFEGYGITKFLMEMKPKDFWDIVAANALFRPGPKDNNYHMMYCQRKSNPNLAKAPHPALEEILHKTFGLFVYQEQLMKACMILAGFTYSEADEVRKVIGKKDISKLPKLGEKFVNRCIQHGVLDEFGAKQLWDQFEKFGMYCFNFSHAVSYALNSYICCFLKALYPKEFYASLMSVELIHGNSAEKDENLEKYEKEARQYFKILFLPVDINKSKNVYTIEDGKIRKPISSVKGLGEETQKEICSKQPYESFSNFYLHTDTKRVTKATMEALIMNGAFNCFGDKKEIEKQFKRCMEMRTAVKATSTTAKNKIPKLRGVL